jgi:S1-C subfamily serine protease
VIRSSLQGDSIEGLGFAIPSNVVRPIVVQLIEQGRVRRPFLGIQHELVTPVEAELRNLPLTRGIRVTRVEPGTGAARGGVQPGDIITAIDDRPVDEEHPLINVLALYQPGDQVVLTIYRGDQFLSLKVELTERGRP